MATHNKFYPVDTNVVVPYSATYDFPSQSNKAVKVTSRISPKNGATFLPGDTIQIEIPSQGYINPLNSTLAFDVTLSGFSTASTNVVRFQNNIQSIFSRARLQYGSTTIEDIQNYNVIVRCLTEWTSTNQCGSMDSTSVSEGIGGCVVGAYGTGIGAATTVAGALVNARQAYIQGLDGTTTTGFNSVPNGAETLNSQTNCPVRRYQVNLAFGLFLQDKYIPAKWMAGLVMYFSLASETSCIYAQVHGGSGTAPTYSVSNVVFIPEVLEFDASYDAVFLKGLRETGVPIPFSSWHTFTYNIGGQQNVNINITEKSRIIKSAFAIQRRAPEQYFTDSHAALFTSSAGTLTSFQWRVGMRMYPSSPVQCSKTISSSVPNGGAEALLELQKALNIVGDYRLSTNVNTLRWAMPYVVATFDGTNSIALGESDYGGFTKLWGASTGIPTVQVVLKPACGNVGSSCFAMAADFETSNGAETSGINGEEQSDITLIANYSATQASGYNMEVYTQYEALLILRENSTIQLVV